MEEGFWSARNGPELQMGSSSQGIWARVPIPVHFHVFYTLSNSSAALKLILYKEAVKITGVCRFQWKHSSLPLPTRKRLFISNVQFCKLSGEMSDKEGESVK